MQFTRGEETRRRLLCAVTQTDNSVFLFAFGSFFSLELFSYSSLARLLENHFFSLLVVEKAANERLEDGKAA